ncbi:MAG: hypothetical protein IKZ52_06510 [Bacteroidales bacterium]|nr:hypothetical protein [Bacteroidales bacterium]
MTDVTDQNKMEDVLDSIAQGTLEESIEGVKNQKSADGTGTPPPKEPGNHNNPDNHNNSAPSGTTEYTIKYPNIESALFKDLTTETKCWEDKKEFLAFCIMALLSAFVFCKGFCILKLGNAPSGFLLFFFGVIALLVIGLVLLAYFMKNSSTKHHAEKDERENKQLAFRQKMMEKVFELENRDIIAQKQKQEKELIREEKDHLFSLDEQQRTAEYGRRIQLRKYEFVENYLKNKIELAKVGVEKKDTNSSQKDGNNAAQNAASDK